MRAERRSFAFLVVVTLLGGATCERAPRRASLTPRPGGAFTMPIRPLCESGQDAPVDVAAVAHPSLREVSGVASAVSLDRVLWMVSDSGNPASVWGVSRDDGRVLVEIALPVENHDFEDVTTGPCPDLSGPCVFVADTGDNKHRRDEVFVHAFPEPALDVARLAARTDDAEPTRVVLDAVWTMPMTYPGGEQVDVESIVVFPDATALLLFEKTTEPTARIFAYRAPWSPKAPGDDGDDDAPRTLEQTGAVTVPSDGSLGAPFVGDAKVRRITSAALHWSGQRLLLRATGGVLSFQAADPSSFLDLSDALPEATWPSPPDEEQGEAITFDADGTTILTIAEIESEDGTPLLHQSVCLGGAP